MAEDDDNEDIFFAEAEGPLPDGLKCLAIEMDLNLGDHPLKGWNQQVYSAGEAYTTAFKVLGRARRRLSDREELIWKATMRSHSFGYSCDNCGFQSVDVGQQRRRP